MENNKETKRNRQGRYDFNNFDQVCRCGKTLGDHMAEWPHDIGEAGFTCEGFKKKRPTFASVGGLKTADRNGKRRGIKGGTR